MKLRSFLVMLFLLTGAVLFVACEGERGPAGKDGKDGKDGAKGDQGERGPAGPKGDKGDASAKDDDLTDGDSRCDRSNGIDVSKGTKFIQGTNGDDVICANGSDNVIRAQGGDDVVYGADGRDKMIGGEGDDTLYGEDGHDFFFLVEGGADKLVGGEGKDMIVLSSSTHTDLVNPPILESHDHYNLSADDMITADITFDLSSGSFDGTSVETGTIAFEGIEEVFGGLGKNTLIGNDADNLLKGWTADDTLTGGGGDDVLWGWEGDDTLTGGDGDDVLFRWKGDDILTGGAGADIFVIEGGYPSGSHGLPVIKDFNVAEDKIYFNGFPAEAENNRAITTDVGKIKVGTLAAVEIHDGANGASASQATAIKNKKDDVIRFVTATWDKKTRTYTFADN